LNSFALTGFVSSGFVSTGFASTGFASSSYTRRPRRKRGSVRLLADHACPGFLMLSFWELLANGEEDSEAGTKLQQKIQI
jgi:hypothetical protein